MKMLISIKKYLTLGVLTLLMCVVMGEITQAAVGQQDSLETHVDSLQKRIDSLTAQIGSLQKINRASEKILAANHSWRWFVCGLLIGGGVFGLIMRINIKKKSHDKLFTKSEYDEKQGTSRRKNVNAQRTSNPDRKLMNEKIYINGPVSSRISNSSEESKFNNTQQENKQTPEVDHGCGLEKQSNELDSGKPYEKGDSDVSPVELSVIDTSKEAAGKVLYFPNPEGNTFNAKFSHQTQELGVSLFRFEIQGTEAKFEVCQTSDAFQWLISNRSDFLNVAEEKEGVFALGKKIYTYNNSKGEATLQADKWIVTKKLQIKYA